VQEQMIGAGISMEQMADSLAVAGDDEKMTARDLLALVEQVAACLVLCGLAQLVF
jgi:non-ribosomal peptide synthetase component E (peptide arylation enzyme)